MRVQRIISAHDDIGAQFSQVMDQIIGKAVVVINQLVGPPFFRFVLRYVGEAGKVLPPEADARLVVDDEESKKTSKLPKTNDVHPLIQVYATAITSATPVSKATVSVH